MRPYSPGGTLNALATAQQGSIPATPSVHRLRRGLPGYLILFAPHAFAPQRQYRSRKPPSPPVFLRISTNFTSTLGIPLPSPVLKMDSFKCTSWVEPRDFTSDLSNRLRALYAQLFRTTLAPSVLPRLLARSWPVLPLVVPSGRRAINPTTVLPTRQGFTTRRPSSPTRRRCVRVSPIAQDSSLLPPVGVWTVFQFQCG